MAEPESSDALETPDGAEADALVAGVGGGVERAVAFYLGGQRYALPIDRVNEIQQIVAFSDVPAGGQGVVGMVNLRGTVIPAIDLRRAVGVEPREYTLETPMIITRTGSQTVALIVDEVEDVIELPEDCLQEAPPMHALSSKMIGVCRLPDGLMYLLDIDR
ncbi:MAG: chemotaxis protein CheW, partial [Gaiellaceae bacterium]